MTTAAHPLDRPPAAERQDRELQDRERQDRERQGGGAMFDKIARRYDLLNRVISMGIDRRWRRRAVAALDLRPGARVLDLATGTADVALEVLRQEPSATVLGLDPSPRMLEIGRQKIAAAGLDERIELVTGTAEVLDLDDDSVDGVTIAFGIRNVPERERAVAEMARVTRPGGRITILELSEPRSGLLAPFARFHVHKVVPRIGAFLSGEREYRYLEESIAAFPPPEEFAGLMRRAGCEVVEVRPLTLGTCCLYVGQPTKGIPEASPRDPHPPTPSPRGRGGAFRADLVQHRSSRKPLLPSPSGRGAGGEGGSEGAESRSREETRS